MPKSIVRICALSIFLSTIWAAHTYFFSNGWQDKERVAQDLASLQAHNAELRAQQIHLSQQIQAIQTRPEVQERVIRDKLGYVKPGEWIIEFAAEP